MRLSPAAHEESMRAIAKKYFFTLLRRVILYNPRRIREFTTSKSVRVHGGMFRRSVWKVVRRGEGRQ